MHASLLVVVLVAYSLGYLGFLLWYGGRSAAMTAAESDSLLEWDSVILVRYRSRRDFLSMCAELASRRADVHKWAAIEKTHVFPVRVGFSLILIRVIAGCLFAFLGGLTFLGLG